MMNTRWKALYANWQFKLTAGLIALGSIYLSLEPTAMANEKASKMPGLEKGGMNPVESLQLPPAISNPIELGSVRWFRDIETAQAAAKKSNREILLLFQEVPG